MSASVFPARAGMSPEIVRPCEGLGGVPRASGDEPVLLQVTNHILKCSPRERG